MININLHFSPQSDFQYYAILHPAGPSTVSVPTPIALWVNPAMLRHRLYAYVQLDIGGLQRCQTKIAGNLNNREVWSIDNIQWGSGGGWWGAPSISSGTVQPWNPDNSSQLVPNGLTVTPNNSTNRICLSPWNVTGSFDSFVMYNTSTQTFLYQVVFACRSMHQW